MPPALSDEETSDYESAQPIKSPRKSNSISSDTGDAPAKPRRNGRASRKEEKAPVDVDADVYADLDEEEDEEDQGDDLDEDVFIVEAIKKHMIDEDGTLKFHVKWEGYEKKSDMTWEPEENLRESASEILSAYLESIGGRDKIFEETHEAAKGKKRNRTTSTAQAAGTKRSKKNGTHPSNSTPPATADSWSPPAGSWEDDIETIDACEDEGSGQLIVYLVWKNGRKTRHHTKVIYKKCPQKMLAFYERHVRIIREENRQLTE